MKCRNKVFLLKYWCFFLKNIVMILTSFFYCHLRCIVKNLVLSKLRTFWGKSCTTPLCLQTMAVDFFLVKWHHDTTTARLSARAMVKNVFSWNYFPQTCFSLHLLEMFVLCFILFSRPHGASKQMISTNIHRILHFQLSLDKQQGLKLGERFCSKKDSYIWNIWLELEGKANFQLLHAGGSSLLPTHLPFKIPKRY